MPKPRPMPITDRQREFVEFIRSYRAGHGYAPSVRDITEHFGLKSPRYVHQVLQLLTRKGHLRTTPGVARSAVVLTRKGT